MFWAILSSYFTLVRSFTQTDLETSSTALHRTVEYTAIDTRMTLRNTISSRTPTSVDDLRNMWVQVKESDEAEWMLDACDTYAVPFLILNLFFYSAIANPIISSTLLLGILVHESGHYLVQRYYGYKPGLYVFPIIGAGISEEYDKEDKADLSAVGRRDISLAGPAAELLFSAAMGALYLHTGRLELFAISVLFPLNALFNLFPAWEFDGGMAREVYGELRQDAAETEATLTLAAHGSLIVANIALMLFLISARPTGLQAFVRGIIGT